MIASLLVLAAAAIVTTAITPVVGRLARRAGVVDLPGDPRKVHDRPVPTLGGLAMLVGFVAALGAAWLLPAFRPVFEQTSEPVGLLLGCAIVALVGVVDDVRGLSPPIKLAGQILAALVLVLHGIQIVYAWVPGLGVLVLSPDLGLILTVMVIVAMVNAVNFIDGLDGLAAGVVAIGAVAFFAFSYGSEARGIAEAAPTSATFVVAALAGMTLGFLVHNFHPARIIMGDTGAMLLGLLLAASGVGYVGRSTDPSYTDFVAVVPLLFMPALVLAIPFLDTVFAIARRIYNRQPITVADRGHLHHRMLDRGIPHRRAVLLLYYWSAVVAFAAVGALYVPRPTALAVLAGAGSLGVLLTLLGLRRGAAVAAEEPGERRRESG